MNTNTKNTEYQHPLLFNLPAVHDKNIEISFTGADVSSDGGLLLLKECEENVGILEALTACLNDDRNQSYIDHTYLEMVNQRVLQIAAGYEDANDCNSLKSDNILKLCSGRLPTDNDLASQPTMCRLENSVSNRELYAIARAFLDNFISSYNEEPSVIIIDADDSNFDTYGSQQLALF